MSRKENQVGDVIVKNGEIIGLELFDHPKTFQAFKEDIYKKYAIDIAKKGKKKDLDPRRLLEKLLKELETGKVTRGTPEQNIGGENIFIETPSLRAVVFHRGKRLISLSVVRKEEGM